MLSELFLNGLILPAVAAFLFVGLAVRTGHTWLRAAAVAAALLAASLGLGGLPELGSGDAVGLLVPLAVAAIPIAVWSRRTQRTSVRWGIRLVFVAGGVALLVEPLTAHAWGAGQAVGWGAALSLMIVAAWAVIDRFNEDGLALGESAVVAISLGGGAAATAAIATLTLGIHAGALATAVGAASLVNQTTDRRLHPEAIATLVPLVGFVWVVAYLYGGIPGVAMMLIAVAPLVGLGAIALGRRVEYPRAAVALAALLAVGAVGSSVFVAEQPAGNEGVEEAADDSGSYVPY